MKFKIFCIVCDGIVLGVAVKVSFYLIAQGAPLGILGAAGAVWGSLIGKMMAEKY